MFKHDIYSACNIFTCCMSGLLVHVTHSNMLHTRLKANSHGMFSIYVLGAYVENTSSEIEICTVFLTTCGKHTK